MVGIPIHRLRDACCERKLRSVAWLFRRRLRSAISPSHSARRMHYTHWKENAMACNGYEKVWDLSRGELVQLDGARGTALRVTRGMLWITLENDLRDVVLAPGDTFTVDRDGLTLIEAQELSTVCVLALHAVDVRRGPQPTFANRVAAWFSSVGAADSARRFAPYY